MRALLRRQPLLLKSELVLGDLVLDPRRQEATVAGRPLSLMAKEYALLEYLARNIGVLLTRCELTNHVWDNNHDPGSHVLEVHIGNLRSKLSAQGCVELIRTRRGYGYAFGPT